MDFQPETSDRAILAEQLFLHHMHANMTVENRKNYNQ